MLPIPAKEEILEEDHLLNQTHRENPPLTLEKEDLPAPVAQEVQVQLQATETEEIAILIPIPAPTLMQMPIPTGVKEDPVQALLQAHPVLPAHLPAITLDGDTTMEEKAEKEDVMYADLSIIQSFISQMAHFSKCIICLLNSKTRYFIP